MAENGIIPVIDFESCGLSTATVSDDSLKQVGEQIKDAFMSVGFCYLKNHGMNKSLLEQYKDLSKQFFQEPYAVKQNYAIPEDGSFGWVALERERLNPDRPGDLKESFNFVPNKDRDNWPTEELHQTTKDVYENFTELAFRVCDALSVGLGIGETFMRDAHSLIGRNGNNTTLRSLYYPPLSKHVSLKPGQIRLGEHSDYNSFSMLYQDEIGGLEVNVPGKGFVPATPIPGTVVVNIGDLMQRWTSDKLIATAHRVLIPETETKLRTHRQSIAFFVHPNADFVVKCLDGSDKYEPITPGNYLQYKLSETF